MIRVTVELLPFGDESRKRLLGTVHVANDGTGTEHVGSYLVREFDHKGRYREPDRRIRGYSRRFGWLPLVFMALQTIAEGWATRRAGSRYGMRHYFPWKAAA